MAGLASSIINTPIEFVKIRTQIDSSSQRMGSARRLLEILKTEKIAGLRQIYTGLGYTILKEAPGLGLYYGGFHIFMQKLFNEVER